MGIVIASLLCGFALELVLCLWQKKTIRKLIPIFLVIGEMVVLWYMYDFGALDGLYSEFTAETLLMAFMTWSSMMLVAMLLAFPVSWLVERIRGKKDSEIAED